MRKYYINEKGEEVTNDLNDGPPFFTSHIHFVNQTVSNEYLPDADHTAKTSFTQKDYTIR